MGLPFLQMHDNFSPKDFDKVLNFLELIPKNYPLAIEFRHTEWYNDKVIANALYNVLETKKITNVLVDAVGRRDIMHMCLTAQTAFVRYEESIMLLIIIV